MTSGLVKVSPVHYVDTGKAHIWIEGYTHQNNNTYIQCANTQSIMYKLQIMWFTVCTYGHGTCHF